VVWGAHGDITTAVIITLQIDLSPVGLSEHDGGGRVSGSGLDSIFAVNVPIDACVRVHYPQEGAHSLAPQHTEVAS